MSRPAFRSLFLYSFVDNLGNFPETEKSKSFALNSAPGAVADSGKGAGKKARVSSLLLKATVLINHSSWK